jgi:hypothetical protein
MRGVIVGTGTVVEKKFATTLRELLKRVRELGHPESDQYKLTPYYPN